MHTLLWISNVLLWAIVLGVGFLLLGTLRSLGMLQWRLDHLEATRPSRIGRAGLSVGKTAPDFTLPTATGRDLALREFTGHKVLLVFTQSGCGPCHSIVPELNRIHDRGEPRVLVINNGGKEDTRKWAEHVQARFPIIAQEKFTVSKRYEVYATPFAFLIDERGVVASKGIASSPQYIRYVLDGAGDYSKGSREIDSKDDRHPAESSGVNEVTLV